MNVLERVCPLFTVLRSYRRADLASDIIAGVTVGVLLVPQSMGYAMLAGLPPAVGLYSCTLPLIVYALLGTSRQLAVGPVAMMSLLINAQVAPLAKGDPTLYLSLAVQMALIVGVLQAAMGALRLGALVNFLSHAVTSGFTSAAAIIIMLSQLKHLLGIKMDTEGSALAQIADAARGIGEAQPVALLMGLGAIAVLIAVKRRLPRVPGPMVVAVLGTAIAQIMRLDQHGLAVVGDVPRGLPGLAVPSLDFGMLGMMLPAAITISLIGFVESIAVANIIAARERYRVSADRELIALGAANLAAAAVGAYPVTGGLSRTAVNHQAGARTGLASIVTALLIVATLLFLTPLFHFTPKAVLAGLVVVSVAGLVDLREFRSLWTLRPSDAASLGVTFLVTLTLNVEIGIVSGVVFSLALFVWRSAHPRIVEVGLVEHDGAFRDITRFPDARTYEGVLIMRVDAALYFANMRFVEERLQAMLAERRVNWVVFDLTSVNDMDGVAAHTLHEWTTIYEQQGIRFAFAGMKGPVRDLVLRAGWPEQHARQVSLQKTLEEIGVEPTAAVSPSPPTA